MKNQNILVWLPSPMGDAVMATPALRAIKNLFADTTHSRAITFAATQTAKDILCPCPFADDWLITTGKNTLSIVSVLKERRFSRAVLLKNSFGCALAAFLARIPERIGYARDARSVLLTHKLFPSKNPDGSFKPAPMTDYYLAIARHIGADVSDKSLYMEYDQRLTEQLKHKLPALFSDKSPLVILVPGGMFGPSKCWPAERFAQTADYLNKKYNAKVFVSVAPNAAETTIAEKIRNAAAVKLFDSVQTPLSLAELKTLFACADLVITNDTGPRHIAIALKRKVITMFGPNDPEWTQAGCKDEIQIAGTAPCAPCRKPKCKDPNHTCMNSITVETVCAAADKLLKK